ncbi:MAG: hypothetical protein ABJN26_23810 [Stappiaceae bacterium]
MSKADWLFTIGFFLFACGGTALSAISPVKGEAVAVWANPFTDSSDVYRIISAADGEIIRSGKWSGIAVATSADPDFLARLYKAGALFVSSPIAASGCLALNIQEMS